MTQDVSKELNEALSFVESLELPEIDELEAVETGGPIDIVPPKFREDVGQTITVGSQLAGFAASVSAELRPHISNSFLLAQLAANKFVKDNDGSSRDWYDKYIQVLNNIGWVIEGDAAAIRVVEGTSLQVHQEIIPIITAALGPGAVAASTILNVLNGLASMEKDKPWITLFDRASQRASANQFQVSFASVEGGRPRITLACFELDASNSVVQVLFFKFSDSHAKLKHFEIKASINESVFNQVKDHIAARVIAHTSRFIADIQI